MRINMKFVPITKKWFKLNISDHSQHKVNLQSNCLLFIAIIIIVFSVVLSRQIAPQKLNNNKNDFYFFVNLSVQFPYITFKQIWIPCCEHNLIRIVGFIQLIEWVFSFGRLSWVFVINEDVRLIDSLVLTITPMKDL